MQRIAFAILILTACEKNEPATQPPAAEPDASRPEMTAAQCEADGGTVVGDIGDGAVMRPDYVCESNGEPPVGTITAEAGAPIGVEGSVCCGA